MRFRILPLIIFFSFALVVAKVFDLAIEKSTKQSLNLSTQASAENKDNKDSKESKDSKDSKKEAAPEAKKGEAEKKPADGKDVKAETKGEPPKTQTGKEAAKEPAKEGAAADPNASPNASGVAQKNAPKSIEITDQVPMEKALLENLAKRRMELDDWANSIAMKESVLNATEKKINSKMEELKKLETDVMALLAQYKTKEEEKNKKLVKIYEGMKPADAAKIFDTMDMAILLEIAGNMKEDNAAKIMSKMNTNKAKELTTKIAEQKRLASNAK